MVLININDNQLQGLCFKTITTRIKNNNYTDCILERIKSVNYKDYILEGIVLVE